MMVNLDCSQAQNSKLCSNPKLRVKSYPSIRYYPFGLDNKQDSTMKYSPSATFEDIEDEVMEDMHDDDISKYDQTSM